MSESEVERVAFDPGDRLFSEGDAGDFAYIIGSGQVDISKKVDNDEVVVAVLGKGEMVGEMALIDDQPRAASVRATEATVAIVIPREAFEQRLAKADPVLRRMLQILIRRLRAQTDTVVRKSTVIR